MNVMKSLVFSDGTIYSTSGHGGHLWAITASPVTGDAVEQDSRARASVARAKAKALEMALVAMDIDYRASDRSSDDSLPQYGRAYLSGSTVFVLVDEEQQVVEPDFDRGDQNAPLFVKTSISVERSLLESGRSRLKELQHEALSLESQPIEGLPWRVLKWFRTQELAAKFMPKIIANSTVGSTMFIAQAQVVG